MNRTIENNAAKTLTLNDICKGQVFAFANGSDDSAYMKINNVGSTPAELVKLCDGTPITIYCLVSSPVRLIKSITIEAEG